MSDATSTGTEALVCADIAKRQRLGLAKYGQTVAANPLELRQWLQHAYEETLDKAIYLKRAIAELPPQPQVCRACNGDGLEEIQSGPYHRPCSACRGRGWANDKAQATDGARDQ